MKAVTYILPTKTPSKQAIQASWAATDLQYKPPAAVPENRAVLGFNFAILFSSSSLLEACMYNPVWAANRSSSSAHLSLHSSIPRLRMQGGVLGGISGRK